MLADYSYDSLGRPTALARGNGAGTSWSYVANSRNWSLTQDLSGTAHDLTLGFTFSPAPQVTGRAISNTAYSFAPPTLSEAYARDGLNRYTSVAGQAFTYDVRQNLTDDGPDTYGYDVENRLTGVSGASAMTLAHDPLGRLKQTVSGATTTRFLYDGDRLVAEYNAAGTTVTARYAHGAGVDAPLIWYEGAGLTDRRWLHADAQGSIIAVSGATGAIVGSPYSYSPYGEPDAVNGWGGSRFRYTGQISLRHAPLWHYKARAYDPALGRFLQTDPVGYEDQMNLYAYVANDPINYVDPTGRIQQIVSTCTTKVVAVEPGYANSYNNITTCTYSSNQLENSSFSVGHFHFEITGAQKCTAREWGELLSEEADRMNFVGGGLAALGVGAGFIPGGQAASGSLLLLGGATLTTGAGMEALGATLSLIGEDGRAALGAIFDAGLSRASFNIWEGALTDYARGMMIGAIIDRLPTPGGCG